VRGKEETRRGVPRSEPEDAKRSGQDGGLGRLVRFVRIHESIFVLTGAGVSTESGIPDYRNLEGEWKRPQPVQYGAFVRKDRVRQRYWARSMVGWRRFAGARPGRSHRALAGLESAGWVGDLVTQNVDRLHQQAGSLRVIDLHGRLDRVVCLTCGHESPRELLQRRLEEANPRFRRLTAAAAPDGDADLEGESLEDFRVPCCERCGGVLKPDVVFFGESVPRGRVAEAFRRLEAADAVLVVGSSLMVWSGYRFCRAAVERGIPIAAVNLGRTRADDDLALKISEDCGPVLAALAERLARTTRG
jgi:NAD-dependent SIR2 family protein deacetylase